MENKVVVQDNKLAVTPTGFSKILSFKKGILIPLKNVKRASVDQEIVNEPKGFKNLGTGLPGYVGGLFTNHGIKTFYNIKTGEIPVVIELENEKYDRLVLGVEDPEATVDEINKTIK